MSLTTLTVTGASRAPAAVPQLELLRELLTRLHDEGVAYCHWKSNEHLDASMVGRTDLDVLVDRRAALSLARILGETGFKRFPVAPGRGYPAIEDYLGLDAASGRLSHLHVHYQLILGERYLKSYRLPWEHVVLESRRFDATHDLYIADAHVETLLLVVRAALKLRWRDRLRGAPMSRGARRELQWLAARIEDERLIATAAPLIGAPAAARLPAIARDAAPTAAALEAFRRLVRPSFSTHRSYSPGGARWRRWRREWSTLGGVALNHARGDGLSSRTAATGGLMVAFVGADGAGKSTVTRAVAAWLSRNAAVIPLYGGSGSGSRALWIRALRMLGRWGGRHRNGRPHRDASATPGSGAPRSLLKRLLRAITVLTIAAERRRMARRAARARMRGKIVVCDRLPQTQFPGLNDGPRLGNGTEPTGWLSRLAERRELEAIEAFEAFPPDLVIKLHVSEEVARRRKPDTPPQQLALKLQIVRLLRYGPPTTVVQIDADQPLEDVLTQAKRAIWDCI